MSLIEAGAEGARNVFRGDIATSPDGSAHEADSKKRRKNLIPKIGAAAGGVALVIGFGVNSLRGGNDSDATLSDNSDLSDQSADGVALDELTSDGTVTVTAPGIAGTESPVGVQENSGDVEVVEVTEFTPSPYLSDAQNEYLEYLGNNYNYPTSLIKIDTNKSPDELFSDLVNNVNAILSRDDLEAASDLYANQADFNTQASFWEENQDQDLFWIPTMIRVDSSSATDNSVTITGSAELGTMIARTEAIEQHGPAGLIMRSGFEIPFDESGKKSIASSSSNLLETKYSFTVNSEGKLTDLSITYSDR